MDSSLFLTTIAAAIGLVTHLSVFLTTVAAAAAIGLRTLLRKLRFHQDNEENVPSSSPLSSLSPVSDPSPSSPRIWTHDVFPSFRGEDVRRKFLSHVQTEFKRKGITPFIDNEIKRGESIGPELISAIRGSKIAIILLSRNYASSKWCLDELVEIMKCREELGQTVMAVFYEVDPSDVKKLAGEFGRVFRKTCAGKTKECTERWKQALAKVATIAGYHSINWDTEAAMIEKITTDISNMLNNFTPSNDFEELVGMEAHLQKMEPLLCLGSDEVRMIGIWGPPGIGKTTIARVAYYQLSNRFQLSVFMDDLKAIPTRLCSDDYSLKLQLQQHFMSQITNHKDIVVPHLGVASNRLKDKKVLVVLDGVDKSVQLDAIAKDTRWFGPGSRIIITTQDQKLLRAHGVNQIYKVDFPINNEALEIFCTYSFGQKSPKDGFEELAREVTGLAGKLPLGLKVMGSYFRGMSKQEWTNSLPRLRTSLNADIRSILKFSYDALDDEDKYLFLHIACFFNFASIHKVEEHLATKFLEVRQRLKVLADKSLISIDDNWRYNKIRMHSLLEKLGREIVRKQSMHEPGQRQFLYDDREICEVLTGDATGSTSAIGLKFDYARIGEELDINEKAFERIPNLQFLKVYGSLALFPLIEVHKKLRLTRGLSYLPHKKLRLTRGLSYLPQKLRLLDWSHFPLTCFPSNVNVELLVELIMTESKLEKLWEGIKSLRSLKWMDLSNSVNLKELPDLSTATNLERLDLRNCSSLIKLPSLSGNSLEELRIFGCKSLVEFPSFIGNAVNLRKLNLRDCSSLIKLPSLSGNSLEELYINGCTSLVEFPSFIGNAVNLRSLDLRDCSSLIKLPSLCGNSLEELYINGCTSLVEFPSFIGNAVNLRELNLRDCSSLIKLPSLSGNSLEELYISGCTSLVEFPSFIGNAVNLRKLNLRDCSSLIKLPSLSGNSLEELDIGGCTSLVEFPSFIGNAVNLRSLDLSSFPNLLELPSYIGNATSLETLDLSNCLNLVELPLSFGNLQKLQTLILKGCSKLEVLPTNINLESLDELDLSDCSMLKRFPEISTNIRFLDLIGTAIEQVPPSIMSWPRLEALEMSYFENLKDFPHALEKITELCLTDTEIQEVHPCVKKMSRLRLFELKGCRKLVSLPPIPDDIWSIDARDCESLEILECSFHNQYLTLNFANCFKLNQEARDLIIKSNSGRAVLPGGKVPEYFTHRATGGGPLTIKLNEKPLPKSMRFKACILLLNKGDHGSCSKEKSTQVYVKSTGVHVEYKYSSINLWPALAQHLYTFRIEAKVTSSELLFKFKLRNNKVWKIGECGIVQDLEVPSC